MEGGELVDLDFLDLEKAGKVDGEYQRLVEAIVEGTELQNTPIDHTIWQYGKVNDYMLVADLPGGPIIMIDSECILIPHSERKGLLDEVHLYNQSFDYMYNLVKKI